MLFYILYSNTELLWYLRKLSNILWNYFCDSCISYDSLDDFVMLCGFSCAYWYFYVSLLLQNNFCHILSGHYSNVHYFNNKKLLMRQSHKCKWESNETKKKENNDVNYSNWCSTWIWNEMEENENYHKISPLHFKNSKNTLNFLDNFCIYILKYFKSLL